jgi:predicted RNase H-like HicB family nuclease
VPTHQEITVHAFWDDEASVWVAESEQVPGLVTEADTLELLASKLEHLIPELLEMNAPELKSVSTINLRAERTLHAV